MWGAARTHKEESDVWPFPGHAGGGLGRRGVKRGAAGSGNVRHHPSKMGVKGPRRRHCGPEGRGEPQAQPEKDPFS